MYEDKKKKGGGKKKGSAKESDAQEAKNLVDDMPVDEVAGAPKKKGAAAAKTGGDKKMTAKELKAEGKKLKQQARDKKKADRKSARATKKSDRKTKKSQKLQDKIDLQTLKGEQKLKSGDVVSSKAKRDRVEKLKAKKEKLDGAAKKKGSADFKGGLHAKNTKHSESGEHLGAKRMGFTQNFGAARQNSYSQGAAKVASIMSFGASKKKGAADPNPNDPGHTHSMTQKDINTMRSDMGDFKGTEGGGGYANRDNYSSYRKSSKSLPKGVIQDYVSQGGSTNPNIAKNELQSVLSKTRAGFGGSGTSSSAPFKDSRAHDPRAYYAPDNRVSGIDPQTGDKQTYQDFYSAPNVNKFSTAFQSNIGQTIKLRKEGVNEGIKSKGIANAGGIKAPLLGASKKPHAKKKKY